MPHGGARSRSGPAPDPNAIRRERPEDQAGWVTLPASRTGPTPAWPLPGSVSVDEMAHWVEVWKTPQATMWEAENNEVDVALYVRTLITSIQPGAAVGLVKEARMMRDDLGLSPGAALRKRWKVGTAPAADSTSSTATVTPIRPARTNPSAKDRFRRVPPTEPATEE